ncbi:HAD family acid phosphatase [Aliiglaciecola sp. 2_MG-2023]|uniref:5'-nucleotidase, lipoprotein e(P4) family n=1 Tax=unclassified Aliiglaciecola TaxID=2593648 RepID=UPI0026E115FF|nr:MULTISPECIES: HAD family acid phosphatase [unclassified Aliiglaciecola]MDO6710481.1 HAD family acid phosphatase [Aliiglaciecola sp. 2_MG-2023]MDO6751654.1 HAD family acid phosphatase [Aliiglaciecola sp. 1_MG-2023]
MRFLVGLFSLAVVVSLSGCVVIHKESSVDTTNELSNLNSTLWMQTSAEYQANALQTYKAAELQLTNALNDTTWTSAVEQQNNYANLPPAIVLDIDETVLDNSQFQADMILHNHTYDSKKWDQWVAMQAAPEIPGAVAFINHAQQMGIEIIYITNRECKARKSVSDSCPQKQETINNLKNVGIKQVNAKQLFLKKEKSTWSSEKQSRRELVAQSYRIIMLIGDDLGDFLPNVKSAISSTTRKELVTQYQDNWGVKWFVLGNPTYGSWIQVLDKPTLQNLKGL